MKYISKLIILITITSLMTSCDGDTVNVDTDNNSGWIEFLKNADDTVSSTESMAIESIIEIPVVINVPTYKEGLIVNYDLVSISGPDPETIFSNDGKLLVSNDKGGFAIKNGHPFITLNLAEAVSITENMVFDIVLTGTNEPLVVAGIENSDNLRPTTHRVTICSTDLQAFVGTYSVSEEFIAGGNTGASLAAIFDESYQVKITAALGDTTGTKFMINNSTGSNEYYADGTIVTLDNNSEVMFDAGDPLVAGFRTHVLTDTAYDQCDRTLTMIGELGAFGTYRTVLTKQ